MLHHYPFSQVSNKMLKQLYCNASLTPPGSPFLGFDSAPLLSATQPVLPGPRKTLPK
jgi:hypothetical protein